jgi:hypothetical protein
VAENGTDVINLLCENVGKKTTHDLRIKKLKLTVNTSAIDAKV